MEKLGLVCLDEEDKSKLLAKDTIEDRFHVESKPFARGKFSSVKRATHKEVDDIYAAKYIRKRRRVTPEEVWHEVSILKLSNNCPYVIKLYEVFETPLDTILLLEMAHGGDLQTILDINEYIEEPICINMLRDILQGLLFLHENFIAHLDIKPQNIVLKGPYPNCSIKLCDFGLSRYLNDTVEIRELYGTPEYISPEVLDYEPLTLKVDCWGVGVLAYVLLTGISPFGSYNKQETYLNITKLLYSFPVEYFHKISLHAIHFIKKLLVIKPSDRLTIEECLKHAWLNNTTDETNIIKKNSYESNNNVFELNDETEIDILPPPDEGSSENNSKEIHKQRKVRANSAGDQQNGFITEIDSGVGKDDNG